MNRIHIQQRLKQCGRPMASLIGLSILLATAGCQTGPKTKADQTASAATTGQQGAQLWSENCSRCHNFRSPSGFSDAQWEVTAMHMRVIGNLTANEHRAILQFLKSAN